jgi:hypothetical protein
MTTETDTDIASRDEKRIRVRALKIWEADGRADGKHLEHWYQAEREIAAEQSAAVGAPEAPPHPRRRSAK